MTLEEFVAEIADGKAYWFSEDRVLTIHEKAQEVLNEQRSKTTVREQES